MNSIHFVSSSDCLLNIHLKYQMKNPKNTLFYVISSRSNSIANPIIVILYVAPFLWQHISVSASCMIAHAPSYQPVFMFITSSRIPTSSDITAKYTRSIVSAATEFMQVLQYWLGPRFWRYRTFLLVPPPLPLTSSHPHSMVPNNSTMLMVSYLSRCPARCRNFQMIDGY